MQTFEVLTISTADIGTPQRVRREIVRHDTERDVRAKVNRDGRIVIDLKPVEPRDARIGTKFPKEKAAFYRELAIHQDHGTLLSVTAESLRETFADTKPRFRRRIMRVIDNLAGREGVARALELEPELFPDDEVALVDGAYRRGSLARVLRNIAEQLERDADINGKIRNAAWYPTVLIIGAVAVTILFFTVVLPQLRGFYKDMDIKPIWPLSTVISLEDYLLNPFHVAIFLAAIGCIVSSLVAAVTFVPEVRYRIDYAAYQLPVFGPLLLCRRRLRILFAIDLMLRSGENASVLSAAAAVAQGPVMRRALYVARQKLEAKDVASLPDALAEAKGVFTRYQIGVMRSGHEYGQLEDKVQSIMDEERARLESMIELLPKQLEASFAFALIFVVGALAYLMIIPASYATAHIH